MPTGPDTTGQRDPDAPTGDDPVSEPPGVPKPDAETRTERTDETDGPETPGGSGGGRSDAEPLPRRSEAEAQTPQQPPDETGLDEFLARAVDRQIEEQRALREALDELSDAVRALEDKEVDTAGITERFNAAMRRESDAVIAEVRDLRDIVLESSQQAVDPTPVTRALSKELDVLHESIGNTAADIEGIAQALIDLNAGLRDWAGGVDRNIGSLAQTLDELRELAAQSQELHADTIDELRAQADRAKATDEVEQKEASSQAAAERAEIERRLKETEELSLYLADQIEDFDRALNRISDLPTQLEGLLSQALKRTLSAKAKIDKDVEATLVDTLAALEANIDRMDKAVAHLGSSETSRSTRAAAKPTKRRSKPTERRSETTAKKPTPARKRSPKRKGKAAADTPPDEPVGG